MLRKLLVLASASFLAAPSFAQTPNVFDGFEGPGLSAFWSAATIGGTYTVPSSALVHSGNGALRFDTQPNVPKDVEITHAFGAPIFGHVSIWLYDSGADVFSSNYMWIRVGDFLIGTYDYDLGPGSGGSTYLYEHLGVSEFSSIDRTKAWHHFQISVTATGWALRIDDQIVESGPEQVPFTSVTVGMHAPAFRPGFQSHWDDFSVTSCLTPPCGQENSPCATLLVNAAGATGVGPFTVSVPSGGTLSFQWSGPPAQPILLLGSSALSVGQSVSGVTLDLSPSGLTILLGALDPVWGGLFFTNGAGSASQSFSVPPVIAGSTLFLQGVVFDSNHSCGPASYRTTAAFAVHL